jgi:intracellular sulfur oxidation DsrE/DsrF family protein
MFSLTQCVGAAVAGLVAIAPLGPALSQGQKNLSWMKPDPASSRKSAASVRLAAPTHRAKAAPRPELASRKNEAGTHEHRRELAKGSESVSDKTAAADPKSEAPLVQPPHHAVIQVTQNDPAVINMALNNAENLTKYYRDKGEQIEIELVAYGPGLHMLRSDTSPVKVRLAVLAMDNMIFSACGNTLNAQAKQEGKEITLVPEARIVPSGIARIIELQEQHWTYVRP